MKLIELIDRDKSLTISPIKIVTVLSEGYDLTITVDGGKKIVIHGFEKSIRELNANVLDALDISLNTMGGRIKIFLKDYECRIL